MSIGLGAASFGAALAALLAYSPWGLLLLLGLLPVCSCSPSCQPGLPVRVHAPFVAHLSPEGLLLLLLLLLGLLLLLLLLLLVLVLVLLLLLLLLLVCRCSLSC